MQVVKVVVEVVQVAVEVDVEVEVVVERMRVNVVNKKRPSSSFLGEEGAWAQTAAKTNRRQTISKRILLV